LITGNSDKISKRPYFDNLTGLRFLGALSVFFFHIFTLNREIWGEFYEQGWFEAIYKVVSKGHLGINLFFVLSGFLITYLLLWEQKQNGKINLLNYLMRRTLRVWPLYFLIVVFGFFIFPKVPYGIETVHELWRYVLFLANFDELIIGLKDNINFLTAIWTVSVEEQFYIVWGILIGLFSFRSKYSSIIFFTLILVGSIVFRAFHIGDERVLYFHSFSVMSDLAIGGILGYLAFYDKIKSAIENMPKWTIVLVYAIGSALILTEGKLFTGYAISISRFIPGLFFGFVILEQVYAKNSFYKIDRIPLMKFSGEISYGFYMFHCIFIYYWSIFFSSYGLTDSIAWFMLYAVVVFLSTYTTAILSYRYFEQPFLRLKKRFK
jgi:peptidoglycan/LPS O-acetylase OafA/YrhL